MAPVADELVRLCSALGLGHEPRAILDPLQALYADLDQRVSGRAMGLELPCKPGCDACCHESVFLSGPEFLLVASQLLETRSHAELCSLIDAMRVLAEQFADELELLEIVDPGEERDEVAARIRFRCPLLGENGRCTIYAVRELNARTFGQSWDRSRGAAYGCALTHARLRVLPESAGPQMFDAHDARRRLVALVPGTERVQVYPWWFARFGDLLVAR